MVETSRYLVRPDRRFRLADHDPADTAGIRSSRKAKERMTDALERMWQLQDMLYAQDRWAVLFVFQAMDAAGKDGVIKHVMSGLNPQGCQVYAFKQPSAEELDHDFLWRVCLRLPERGRIGVFNRSHYEEVLVVRVHPELLKKQRLPVGLAGKGLWKGRYEDINAFERHLARNGTVVRKFFLHVSREEQRRRFLARVEEKEKNWKLSLADVHERDHWDDYMRAYEKMVAATSTEWAPWYVVPADRKWFTRLVVSEVICETLESLDLHYPKTTPEQKTELEAVRAALEAKEHSKRREAQGTI